MKAGMTTAVTGNEEKGITTTVPGIVDKEITTSVIGGVATRGITTETTKGITTKAHRRPAIDNRLLIETDSLAALPNPPRLLLSKLEN